MGILKRPLMIVPVGLKEIFLREARQKDVVILHEIREIDPTFPGLGEYDDLLAGDNDNEEKKEEPPKKPVLKLVVRNGRRLD